MKNWKKNKSYVYYIPELDEVYVADYKPDNSDFTTVKEFREGFLNRKIIEMNFNPDVLILMNNATYEVKVAEVQYIGEL
jgi:hypothetical protein